MELHCPKLPGEPASNRLPESIASVQLVVMIFVKYYDKIILQLRHLPQRLR
jgi:hypothetical protein